MERRGKTPLGTIKTLQAHESSPPISPRSKIDQLRTGEDPDVLFTERDPKKLELYALLGMVIQDVWQDIQANLTDPATEQERVAFEESTRGVVYLSRQEVERDIDQALHLIGPCRKLFSKYRALFHESLEAYPGKASSTQMRVYNRLEALLREEVHAVKSAETVTEEVMAGLGTSGQAMSFVVSSIPDVFRDQYGRLPTQDEWLMIARNSEKLVLTVASKNLPKFIQMGHILRRHSHSVKSSFGGIWNEFSFCIEGEGETRSLGVQGGPLEALLTVRSMEEAGIKKAERVGCPALYVDAIGPLYRAFLRDVEVYLSPHYERLTTRGTGYYD